MFKLLLNINDESNCNISPKSEYAIKLRNVQVIILDEITMTSKHVFEAVDKLFRDISTAKRKNHVFWRNV